MMAKPIKAGLPEPIKSIVADAYQIAKSVAEAPSEADLLHALTSQARERRRPAERCTPFGGILSAPGGS